MATEAGKMLRRSSVRWKFVAFLTMSLCASTFDVAPLPATASEVPPRMEFEGFSFSTPREEGWVMIPIAMPGESKLIHFERDNSNIQFQLASYKPVRRVETSEELVQWVSQGRRTVELDMTHGATCVRYYSRGTQRIVIKDPPEREYTAVINDHALECLHPSSVGKLVRFRYFERGRSDISEEATRRRADALFEGIRVEGLK